MCFRKTGMTFLSTLLAAALGLTALYLLRQTLRARRLRETARAGYFDAVAPLFDEVRRQIQASGFARMAGRWRGMAFDLQAVPDTLTFRKLPSLWVLVTLTEPQPLASTLHILARPGQNDSFTRFTEMPRSLPLPQGFPEWVALRCDHGAGLPSEELVAGLAGLFANPALKEVVISPKGLRLVFLAEEADRGRYLLFRDAEMGLTPLARARLLPQLEVLADLSRRLKEDAHG